MLSDAVKKEIDMWVAKFSAKQKQSAVMPALMIVQNSNNGWLSNELIEDVADLFSNAKNISI